LTNSYNNMHIIFGIIYNNQNSLRRYSFKYFFAFPDTFILAIIIVTNKDNFNKVRYLLMSAVNHH